MPQFKRVDESGNPVFNRVDETGKTVTGRADPNAAIKAQQSAKYPSAQESSVTDTRTPAEVARDQALQAVYGVGGLITGLPGFLWEAGGSLKDAVTGKSAQRGMNLMSDTAASTVNLFTTPTRGAAALAAPQTVDAPTQQEWEQHAQGSGANLAGTLVGGGVSKARAAMPSKARAGAKFDKVNAAAKDVPLNTAEAEAALARAQELRQRGSTMPKVLNDFAKNRKAAEGQGGNFMGQPVNKPMTYEAGRDFASNAGALSKREITAMNAKMQAQVAEFAKAMKTANREAAVKVGMGDVYDSAMKEYAQAATWAERRMVLTKELIKWGGGAVIGAGALKIISDLRD